VRGTHSLKSTKRVTSEDSGNKPVSEGHLLPVQCRGRESQDSKRKQAEEGHSQTVTCKGRIKFGQQKKASKEVAHTNCQTQREGQVMIGKESQQGSGTHILSNTEGVTSHDRERKPARK